jgi:serine/threonine protein kinase
MCPEQLQGERLDGRADLFALGVMAFELLSAQTYFPIEARKKKRMGAMIRRVFETRFEQRRTSLRDALLSEDGGRLSEKHAEEICALLGCMLARKRDHRPSTAEDLLRAVSVLDYPWNAVDGREALSALGLEVAKSIEEERAEWMEHLPTSAIEPISTELMGAQAPETADTIEGPTAIRAGSTGS